jgi:hypothetical protein
MRWVRTGKNTFQLIVLPLHGRGNKDGQGEGVKVLAFDVPKNKQSTWTYQVIDQSMHLTHNFDVWDAEGNTPAQLLIGGKEGIKKLSYEKGRWTNPASASWIVQNYSLGEVRSGQMPGKQLFVAGIEPMHGNLLSVYPLNNPAARQVLYEEMNQGHGLACADFLQLGHSQVVAGWRNPDKENKVGIKLFVPQDTSASTWKTYWIDDNTMACEDLQVADLNGDGRMDIIAAGRATKNLKIYWNRNGAK